MSFIRALFLAILCITPAIISMDIENTDPKPSICAMCKKAINPSIQSLAGNHPDCVKYCCLCKKDDLLSKDFLPDNISEEEKIKKTTMLYSWEFKRRIHWSCQTLIEPLQKKIINQLRTRALKGYKGKEQFEEIDCYIAAGNSFYEIVQLVQEELEKQHIYSIKDYATKSGLETLEKLFNEKYNEFLINKLSIKK